MLDGAGWAPEDSHVLVVGVQIRNPWRPIWSVWNFESAMKVQDLLGSTGKIHTRNNPNMSWGMIHNLTWASLVNNFTEPVMTSTSLIATRCLSTVQCLCHFAQQRWFTWISILGMQPVASVRDGRVVQIFSSNIIEFKFMRTSPTDSLPVFLDVEDFKTHLRCLRQSAAVPSSDLLTWGASVTSMDKLMKSLLVQVVRLQDLFGCQLLTNPPTICVNDSTTMIKAGGSG